MAGFGVLTCVFVYYRERRETLKAEFLILTTTFLIISVSIQILHLLHAISFLQDKLFEYDLHWVT